MMMPSGDIDEAVVIISSTYLQKLRTVLIPVSNNFTCLHILRCQHPLPFVTTKLSNVNLILQSKVNTPEFECTMFANSSAVNAL